MSTTHQPGSWESPASTQATARTRPSRRTVLRGLGLAVGGLAVASSSAALSSCSTPSGADSTPSSLRPVKLGWWGATCEAPLFVAYHRGFFQREGLTVDLVNLGQASAKDALASGKVDGAPGITFEWLKPIEQGQDIKVTGGLHGGCLRLVTSTGSGISDLSGLRGRTIGTEQIGGSAHSFFTVVLSAAGLDPSRDVTFVAFPGAQLQPALERGEIAAVAAADPFPFLIVADGKGTELASNLTGTYRDHYCCAIGLNGSLVSESPATAAALTRAWLSAAQWIGANVDEAARIETDNKYVPIDAAVAAKLLATYYWVPSVTRLAGDMDRYAAEFSTTGILDKATDPKALAAKAFVDVTGGDAGISGAAPGTSTPAPTARAAPPRGRGHHAGHTGHLPQPSATSSATTEQAGSSGYALTSAQREQLHHYACHHGGSPAGRVA